MSGTLRDKRRRLVQHEIAASAMTLFGERGFDAVTVDDIAASVGISPRTFFRYYANKEDVVLQYQRRIQRRLIEALTVRPPEEGAVTSLREAYLATSHVALEDRESVLQTNRFLARSRSLRVSIDGERTVDSPEVVRLLAGRMGVGVSDPRAQTLAVAFGSVAGAAFQRWIEDGGRGDPADQIAAALDLLARGLSELDIPPQCGNGGAN